jgi:copper chaperone CopZ
LIFQDTFQRFPLRYSCKIQSCVLHAIPKSHFIKIMKTNKSFLGFCLSLIISASTFAQNQRTEDIKVWGNCGMCEATIEKAAKSAGATEADWSPETKVLNVSYRPSKTSAEKIQQAIAATGYDTRDFKGSDEAYANLHGCCKYDRKPAAVQNQIAAMTAAHGHEASCCKDGKCTMGKDAACCKDGKCTMAKEVKSMKGKDASCCKDGKCTMGKDAPCCKDGKCTKAK